MADTSKGMGGGYAHDRNCHKRGGSCGCGGGVCGKVERATPPSPSTAPEVGERAAFEAWARDPIRASKLPLERWPTNGAYKDTRTYIAFYGWKSGRAALASPPAEVDDWMKLSEQKPEVGESVLVWSDNWGNPMVLRYRVQPWESLLDAEQGRWFWYPERMIWKRFSAPSHTTIKEK